MINFIINYRIRNLKKLKKKNIFCKCVLVAQSILSISKTIVLRLDFFLSKHGSVYVSKVLQ